MTDEAVSGWKYEIHVSKETTFGKTITILESLDIRPKIKFYLFGIAAQIIFLHFRQFFVY
jgi:hypothetical protein